MKKYLEAIRKQAIDFIKFNPNMNVLDRNFFERVMMLPDMYELDKNGTLLDDEALKPLREKVRNESEKIRHKQNWE